MDTTVEKRVIALNPHDIRDETLDAFEQEIQEQSDRELGEIESVRTIVFDARTDGGLDSHATIFINPHNHE